ncbi:MAG: NapH/MauN family ferredoxin-type protein, partial [Gammaproteobacteria bacterium]|nr:NapH/MauN family ferredoxin-type protein [Gammaproteobacteria bacterium]
MNYIIESLSQVFGNAPTRPDKAEQSDELKKIYADKKGKLTKADLEAVHLEHHGHFFRKWQRRRWLTLILVNVLFLVSYKYDVQLLEGAMTASRFVGFHMADLNSALQVMLAYKHVVLNLVIGTT